MNFHSLRCGGGNVGQWNKNILTDAYLNTDCINPWKMTNAFIHAVIYDVLRITFLKQEEKFFMSALYMKIG